MNQFNAVKYHTKKNQSMAGLSVTLKLKYLDEL